jgi:hypothetical protein
VNTQARVPERGFEIGQERRKHFRGSIAEFLHLHHLPQRIRNRDRGIHTPFQAMRLLQRDLRADRPELLNQDLLGAQMIQAVPTRRAVRPPNMREGITTLPAYIRSGPVGSAVSVRLVRAGSVPELLGPAGAASA